LDEHASDCTFDESLHEPVSAKNLVGLGLLSSAEPWKSVLTTVLPVHHHHHTDSPQNKEKVQGQSIENITCLPDQPSSTQEKETAALQRSLPTHAKRKNEFCEHVGKKKSRVDSGREPIDD